MLAVLESLTDLALLTIRLFGLPALLVIFLLKGALLGKVVPTSVCLPGYVLGTGATYTDAVLVAVLVTVAYLVGQLVVYGGSRRHGEAFLDRSAVGSSARLDRWFEAYGGAAVVVTNLVPWTRGLVAIPAGMAAYPAWRYALYATSAALVAHVIYAVGPLVGIAVLV